MDASRLVPAPGALQAVRRLAGEDADILGVKRLVGGQHSDTWHVSTRNPSTTVVIREYPEGDHRAAAEARVLGALRGLGGLAPRLLDCDLHGHWATHPTTIISFIGGSADIKPHDPSVWAAHLGHTLATVHSAPLAALADLPCVFSRPGGSTGSLAGPLAGHVTNRWAEIQAAPVVLTHSDFWSGNVLWRDARICGVVDWPGAAVGPRGFDLGWCRLDLVLLFDERVADDFLVAYQTATAAHVEYSTLWDSWAVARSHRQVESWTPNYAPLGRTDLDPGELRRRHTNWTSQLIDRLP